MTSFPPLEPQIAELLEQRHGAGSLVGIERMPLTHGDGLRLERLVLPGTLDGAVRYVVKRLRPAGDWIGRATNDERMREYRLATGGIYRALPKRIESAVVAALDLDDGAALLLHDVAPALVPLDAPLSDAQVQQSLAALARLHSAFFGFPARLTAGLGLCVPGHWLTLFSPATVEREQHAAASGILAGWEGFARLAPEAWAVVEPLLVNPTPLVQALRACPDTIVHGNARIANIGFDGERIVLLDWGQALRAPAALDLGWYLAANAPRLPCTRAEATDIYRQARAAAGRLPVTGELWERELALGLLAGVLRHGWALADDAADWAESVLAARHWLE